MNAKLRLLVCQYYLAEADAVLRDGQFPDVTVAAYPDLCVHPQSEHMAAMQQMFTDESEGLTVVLVGACFLFKQDSHHLAEDATHRIIRENLCFHMFLPGKMTEGYLRTGAYLLTPGWLRQWRQHITAWGFDQPTARKFFAESTTRFVLLDTCIDPEAPASAAACADFLGLPLEILPVGLDYFRLFLLHIIDDWRKEQAQQNAGIAIGRANRKLADYMTAMDLLVKLTRIMTEDEAINGIQEMFTMLFGATSVRYIPDAGDAAPPVPLPSPAPAGESGDYTITDTGFTIRIAYQRLTLGILEVEIRDFNQHRDDYLNMAMSIVNLCGLALANARTIGERERAEAQLRVKTMELARSNAELEQFAYVASHDLQAPLRRIIAFGDLLREDAGQALSEEATSHLAHIQKSADRMRQLIEGLLAFSRISSRKNPIVEVPLSAVARQAVEDLTPRIEETGAHVEIGDLPVVRADALQMYQLLLNLIGNSLKFISKGVQPLVCISSRQAGADHVEIAIQDNGIGFDEKDLDRIFKPFQRLHSQDEYPGSGIGLAVCQKIVQRHGGILTAHSQPGKGATFFFTLPNMVTGEQGCGRTI